MFKKKNNKGQVMILTTIVTGGVVLTASVIAGMLMFYQLREVNDAVESGMAVFAADSGIENSLYCYFKEQGYEGIDYVSKCSVSGGLPNGASYETEFSCVGQNGFTEEACLEADKENPKVYGIRIKSVGKKEKVERIVDTLFGVRFN